MTKFLNRSLAPELLALSLGLAIFGCASSQDGGGCPFTHVSTPTVSPATSCLTVKVLNANGNGSTGGCVSVDLSIANDCTDPLVVQGVQQISASGQERLPSTSDAGTASVTIASHEAKNVEVTSEARAVSALLGSKPITIAFTTSL